MLTLITVDFTVGCSCCLHITMGIVKLSLLLFKYSGNLHRCIGCLQSVVPVISFIYKVSFFKMLK